MDIMKQDVTKKMTKSWANVCGGDVFSILPIMHVINQGKNVKSINTQDLKEIGQQLMNFSSMGSKRRVWKHLYHLEWSSENYFVCIMACQI